MAKETVLLTGGAGYIGSHQAAALIRAGCHVVAVDSLHRGHAAAVPEGVEFVEQSVEDVDRMVRLLVDKDISTVLHFAGLAYVGESVSMPLEYYDQNVGATIRLAMAMRQAGVARLVYSSSCATYGVPDRLPITEDTPQRPVSPYGQSKLFAEQVLRDTWRAWPELGVVALRYFNVAGCAKDGSLGEDHRPETHLIPLLLKTALGQRESFTILGDDYPTPDGSCIRDFVHVEDLCRAHLMAMDAIRAGEFKAFNAGLGHGYSVREVIAAVERVTGQRIPVTVAPRRPGDPPELVCSADRIRTELGWSPEVTELDEIIETAWNWFRRNPEGYPSG